MLWYLCRHEAVVTAAQQRVDTLLAQTLQLRADYNAANTLCTPAPEGLERCKAAAAAWVKYQSASTALDTAQTALQQAATSGPSAQSLRSAKESFVAWQATASGVITGREWAARAAAATKLQAGLAALHEAENGGNAVRLQGANAALVQAQEASRVVLSANGTELKTVGDAKQGLRAARGSLKAATAASRLTAEELSAASQDLDSLLTQVQAQLTATQTDNAAPHQASALIRFDQLNVGFSLGQQGPSALAAVSYSGVVTSGGQQKTMVGDFQVDVSSSSDELGSVISEVLRDSVVDSLRAIHRSLAAVL